MKASKSISKTAAKPAALVGLAFDAEDGQTRLTRGKNFVLCGGSDETHAVMQETATKVNEQLDRRGRRLEDVSVRELRDIICDQMKREIRLERWSFQAHFPCGPCWINVQGPSFVIPRAATRPFPGHIPGLF